MTTMCVIAFALLMSTSQMDTDKACVQMQLNAVWEQAGIPVSQWDDYSTVAYCESGLDPLAEGDGGAAKGWLQVHWDFWLTWAQETGLLTSGPPVKNWQDPVSNARLSYLINEYYDLPRHGYRWKQWAVKPWWTDCRNGVIEFDSTTLPQMSTIMAFANNP